MATQPLIAPDPSWPAMSLAEAKAVLTAPGAKFEMETIAIRGVATRVWKNAPPSLRWLIAASRVHGDRLFTIHEDERVSYEANYRAVAAIAAELVRRGVGKGDRVALAMRNLPEFPAILFAVASIGAIAVPLNAWWSAGELEYGLADSGARLLFVDAERHERLVAIYAKLPALEHVFVARATVPIPSVHPESFDFAQESLVEGLSFSSAKKGSASTSSARTELGISRLEDLIGTPHDWASLPDAALPDAEVAPDDPVTIFYTSGTTGAPKGALGTHRNIVTNIHTSGYAGARTYLRRGEAIPEPSPRTQLVVVPMFHVTACSAGMMGAIASGGTMIYMRKWDALRAMEIIEREKVHVTGGVPTVAWQLLEHPERANYDLSSLEAIAYGGAPSAPELVRRIYEEFGALPGNGWGMTETMATVTSNSAEDYLNRPDSAGLPAAVADVKVTDEAGVEVAMGEIGELWARGPMTVVGYWNKPAASAETFVDGWVRTGDLGCVDDEGFVYILDRAKDMIIRGGENIYSSEVESVLYAHPAVTDCALIGIPHRTLGEEPAAVVHLCPGCTATEAELQAWVRARLAVFKTPVAIRFVAETLPRNANGKILKRDLKGLFADRVAA